MEACLLVRMGSSSLVGIACRRVDHLRPGNIRVCLRS
jgi:hypothetical protein